MAGDIIYLDVDDEITSAAARIRGVEGRRAAVVLPYGSRVATSRINFRLLARDALTHEKRLAVIAGDAATRALAASAGLPVYATVAEYEEAMAAERAERSGGQAAAGGGAADAEAAAPADGARRAASPRPADDDAEEHPLDRSDTAVVGGATAVAGAGVADAAGAGVADAAGAASVAGAAGAAAAGAGAAAAAAAGAAGAAGAVSGARRTKPRSKPPETVPTDPSLTTATTVERPTPPLPPPPGPTSTIPRTVPVIRPALPSVGRTPILIAVAVIALAVVVAGVGAFVLLPSASAVVTPREETIGPISLRIVASTEATEPDIAAGVVPAEAIEVPVEATDSFEATGKRVEEEKAKGTVRFRNKDFTASESIPKGSVVSTSSGIRFRTDRAITVPAAELVGLQVFPATAEVRITAVDAGPDGNVEANTILTIPRGEDPLTLDVTNPDPTTGGTRKEFPRVTQDDVDAAVAALTADLDAAFRDRLDDPDLVSGDATVFPETGALGPAVPNIDPASLVGKEVESFDLGATATGTAIAVDDAPVRQIAEARLQASVEAGHELVDGSSEITESPAVIEGGTIAYPVVATARQIALLDPAVLKAEILGLPLEDARAALARYGDVDLTVWPDWVGTIPTIDSRVDVSVQGPIPIETPEPTS